MAVRYKNREAIQIAIINESDGMTITSGRLPMFVRPASLCPMPEEVRSLHECLGETLVRVRVLPSAPIEIMAQCARLANSAAIVSSRDESAPSNRPIRSAQFGEGQRSATASDKEQGGGD
jgi:hypothetical protein